MELCFGRLPMQVTQPSDDFPHRFMPITLGVSRTNRVCYGIRDKKQTAWDIAVASRIILIHILFIEIPKGRKNRGYSNFQNTYPKKEFLMKRTIREILDGCKESSEEMSFYDFKFCIKSIYAHLGLAGIFPDGSRQSKFHLKTADMICHALEDCFADRKDNLVKWFRHEPCEFCHPQTGNYVKTHVRDDPDAIYCFLKYCKNLNLGQPLDNDSMEYLSYILYKPVEE